MKPEDLELTGSLLDDELHLMDEPSKIALSGMWVAGEDDEQKLKSIETLKNSGFQFDKLRGILKRMYREAQQKEERLASPNWRDHAAYQLGYKKALRDIYALLPKTTQE